MKNPRSIDPLVLQALALIGQPRTGDCSYCGAPPEAHTAASKLTHSPLSAVKALGLNNSQQQKVYREWRKQRKAAALG